MEVRAEAQGHSQHRVSQADSGRKWFCTRTSRHILAQALGVSRAEARGCELGRVGGWHKAAKVDGPTLINTLKILCALYMIDGGIDRGAGIDRFEGLTGESGESIKTGKTLSKAGGRRLRSTGFPFIPPLPTHPPS